MPNIYGVLKRELRDNGFKYCVQMDVTWLEYLEIKKICLDKFHKNVNIIFTSDNDGWVIFSFKDKDDTFMFKMMFGGISYSI